MDNRELRRQAMAAWTAKDWPLAESLLTHVLEIYPKDRDMRMRLREVQRQRALVAAQPTEAPDGIGADDR